MDWFDAGARVGASESGAAAYPPLDDMEVQRWWLGGFGAAWAERPDDGTLDAALTAALQGRAALLRQLRAHGAGRASQTRH